MATPESQGGIDYPDGGFSSGGQIYPISGDLGELAARMQSVVTHNREGNIVFIETFESGNQPWNPVTYGTGGEIVVSNTVYRSSGYSCKLTAGSDGVKAAKIFRRFPYPFLSRYGLEVSWFPGSHISSFVMVLSYMDGSTEHQFAMQYSDEDHELRIYLPGYVSKTFATGVDLTIDYYPLHTLKLVADLESDTYLRAIVNSTEYDLSAYSAYTLANTDPTHIKTEFYLYSLSGQNGFCWVDDVILTNNEPEH